VCVRRLPVGYLRSTYEGENMRTLIAAVIVIWLVIGAVAAAQRGYFGDDRDVNCKTASDTALTIVAGPLNYVGVNPKVKCKTPQPSK
jgi:hypothetical protein